MREYERDGLRVLVLDEGDDLAGICLFQELKGHVLQIALEAGQDVDAAFRAEGFFQK